MAVKFKSRAAWERYRNDLKIAVAPSMTHGVDHPFPPQKPPQRGHTVTNNRPEKGPTHELLNKDELEALDLLATVAGKIRRIIGDGPHAAGDWAEAADKIHQLQAVIMAQAATRAYPDLFRALGGQC